MANPGESELHYPFGDAVPEPGAVIEIAPGLRWLRMALPFALDHINLWLLRDRDAEGRDGWAIVDCGISNDATRAAWEQVFANALDGLPVLRVIVTHMHPDHIGLAHWLTERWSTPERECRLWISATDWNAARLASQSTTGFGGEGAARFFARHGLTDPEALAKVRARSNYYAGMVPRVPERFRRLLDGMTVAVGDQQWQCIVGYGHAPEHIALHGPAIDGVPALAEPDAPSGVLIAGDMVLPRISTNVSVIDLEPEANPLSLFLASLARLHTLPGGTLVLPSHGKPFIGLRKRIDQLVKHHEERFEDVLTACRQGPQSAADLLGVLFKRQLDLHQTTFAMGESIAHLHALQSLGRLQAVDHGDGVQRFALTG